MSQLSPNILLRATTYLMNHDRELPLSRLHVFLLIARKGDATVRDLVQATGMTQPAISRIVGLLGDNPQRGKKEGLGWVSVVPDPADPRRALLNVTPKGRQVIAEIESLGE